MKQTAEEQIKELKQQLAMANKKIAQLTAIIKLQKKVDYRMKLATQLVVNKKRHSA